MSNVEIYNCSQIDTQNAAIRFEGTTSGLSSITNSSIHNGLGWGVYIHGSENVVFRNNNVFGFRVTAINIASSNNITIDNNWAIHTTERPNFVILD
jgi:parallel beta-helix repeat protein